MKRFLVGLVLFLGVQVVHAGAGGSPFSGGQGGRGIGINSFDYSIPAVFAATHTSVATDTSANNVFVTTHSFLLGTCVVNTAGVSSKLELFNANTSTTVSSGDSRIASIDTTAKGTYSYNLYLSSGFAMYNQGTTPADVTCGFLPRSK